MLKALNEGTADIGITLKAPRAKKYRAEKYMLERFSIALPKKHTLAKRKKIPDATFIKRDSTKGISKLIEQSSLLTFVSDQKFDYDIPKSRKIVPLADREMNVEFFKVTLA